MKKVKDIIFKTYGPALTIALMLVAVLALATGCSNEDEMRDSQYGHVQFKLYKQASYERQAEARSESIDFLADAQKVEVVLQYSGSTIRQTLVLNSTENAEFGVRSDKLQLLAGEYTIVGFYLYNKLDEEILSGDVGDDNKFVIEQRGLIVKDIPVDVTPRGKTSFKLVKDLVKETRVDDVQSYPFHSIKVVDLDVKNMFTQEVTRISKVRVNYKTGFKDGNDDEDLYGDKNAQISYALCDTVVWLKAGSYQVTRYTTYSDKVGKNMLESKSISTPETFVVSDNKETEDVEVPILLKESSEFIKDYVALKELWDALDGKNWKYYGDSAPLGSNWNFNKDIDMWGQQPGVGLDSEGRVTSLNLTGYGIRGVVPDAIGQFTELKVLAFGTHDEKIGGFMLKDLNSNVSDEQKHKMRYSYANNFLSKDAREGLSDILIEGINRDPKQKPIKVRNNTATRDTQFGNLTNGITGFSRAMMRLTKLQQLFIANSPVTVENFFRDIQPESPFYESRNDLKWGDLKALMDVEIYNCPSLTALPLEMLTELPDLQALNIAVNKGISGEQLRSDWKSIINGTSGNKIQLLYMGYNNLIEFPEHEELKKMTALGLLDCSNNQIETLHPFGKDVGIVQLFLDNNKIKSIPRASDGFFINFNDVEAFSCARNQIEEFPNIFNANSKYIMGGVDFSENLIDRFEDGDNFKGINASTVNLANNRLTKFPSILFKSGSPIEVLVIPGNGIVEIAEGDMTGKNSFLLSTLDLTYNNLTRLPEDFYATNIPYLFGIDISYNSFSKFPFEPLNVAYLTVFGIRHQRDEAGNRTLREWPQNIYKHSSLGALYMGSNDLRKVDDTISPRINILEIKDNPNISIDMSSVCAHINAGAYFLIYDKTQDIRGCSALGIEN